MQAVISLLNLAALITFIYCVFSIPAQFIRRFRLKRQGKAVSPFLLVFRKILKYWIVTAVILIPLSMILTFLALMQTGASEKDIFVALVTNSLFGNIGTSLLFGYVFMKAYKDSWSHSSIEERNLRNVEQIPPQ